MAEPRQALPRDTGLQVRMVLTMAVSAALLLAVLIGLGWLLTVPKGWTLVLLIVGIAGIGYIQGHGKEPRSRDARHPGPADEARVRAILDRLALMADVQAPRVDVARAPAPLSWTIAVRPSKATVHVTTGLLDRLDDTQLEAVLAHEVAHLMNRDAIVMTVLAGPPAYMLLGLRETLKDGIGEGLFAIFAAPFLALPAALMLAVSRNLSRYREYAADRTAALLTGSPAAVASALMAVDERLHALPKRDLRSAYALDSLNFAPAKHPRWIGRLWATHPRAHRRLKRLDRLERAAHRVG